MTGGVRMALEAVSIGLFCACTGPALQVATDPADALVYVDGRRVEEGRVPFRYYGTLAVDALPRVGDDADTSRIATRREVELAEPVTPWIFPFDFAGELLARLLGGVPDEEVRVELRPNPVQLVEGFEPVEAAELSQRGHAARVAR